MASKERLAKRVLLIGWDAADWQVISPMLDAGEMPTLNQLIERGVMGNIATLQPCLSPMLWTSIATGKFADKHGILGFVEPDGSGGIRLSTSTSRKTKAIWNILSQNGLKTHVVGWYASHPAEPINGVCVSNAFDQNPMPPGQDWPLPGQSVHPRKWIDPVTEFRVHPGEIPASDIEPFIPRLSEVDLKTDGRPAELVRSLAHCASVHAIATAILENEPWDFMAVYYDMIDTAGHTFMPYHPPRMDHVPQRDFDLYSGVMRRVYRLHDQMLGRLLELAGDDTTVVLVSDHGFYCDHRRPRTLHSGDSPEALAAAWHRPFGVLCISGDHIKRDERVYEATLLDIAPTVLMLLGIPPGRDMDGRPLVQALEKPRMVERIESWDGIAGADGMHPPEMRVDTTSAQETIDHLIALGYIEPAAADARSALRIAMAEADFNLSNVYLSSFRPESAIPVLKRLTDSEPENQRYSIALARAFVDSKRFGDACEFLELVATRGLAHPDFQAMHALAEFELGDRPQAIDRLRSVTDSPAPTLYSLVTLGRIQGTVRDWPGARKTYERILAIDGDSLEAHNGMARALIETGEFEAAAEHALRALNVAHQFPAAHFHLGLALEGLGLRERAIQSIETAIRMAPYFAEAHARLARMFQAMGNSVRALHHENAAKGHLDPSNPLGEIMPDARPRV